MTQARQQKKLCFLSCTSDFSMLQKWTVALWWYFTSFINKWYSAYKLLSLYYMLQSDIRNVFGFYSPPQTHPKHFWKIFTHLIITIKQNKSRIILLFWLRSCLDMQINYHRDVLINNCFCLLRFMCRMAWT